MTIRPASGGSATITGDLGVDRASVTIESLTIDGRVTFSPGATGSRLLRSSAMGFNIYGADNVVIEGNTLDGRGRVAQNFIWDQPSGNTPDGWRVTGNTLRNYYDGGNSSTHSEALYIGYSTNGLVDGNTFTNNGNTSHVFFTWFGSMADASRSYPRNICVRGNRFNETHGAYFAINFRPEIPVSSGIRIDRSNVGATTTSPQFNGSC